MGFESTESTVGPKINRATLKSSITLEDNSLESVSMSLDSGGRGDKVAKNVDAAEENKDEDSEDKKELGGEESTYEEEEEEMEKEDNHNKGVTSMQNQMGSTNNYRMMQVPVWR